MANAWTELSRPESRRRIRSPIAALCLAIWCGGCAEAPRIDQSADARIVDAAAGEKLDGISFEGRLGRFNPTGDTLAVIEERRLVFISLDDGRRSVIPLDQTVIDLAFADEDSLWLIGHDGASYWKKGELECSAESFGDSPSLLGVTGDRLDLVTETYVDGGGVLGERVTIGTDCAVTRGIKEQAVETAISPLGDGHQLVARAATIDAGLVRRRGPMIEYRDGKDVLAEFPVFDERRDISRISAMMTGDDRVIALGTGADTTHWELWTIDHPRLVKAGRLAEPSDRMLSFAGTDHVIVGQRLINLLSGRGQPLIGSGVVQDVTDDQAWWLIAEGDRLSLRSAGSLTKP